MALLYECDEGLFLESVSRKAIMSGALDRRVIKRVEGAGRMNRREEFHWDISKSKTKQKRKAVAVAIVRLWRNVYRVKKWFQNRVERFGMRRRQEQLLLSTRENFGAIWESGPPNDWFPYWLSTILKRLSGSSSILVIIHKFSQDKRVFEEKGKQAKLEATRMSYIIQKSTGQPTRGTERNPVPALVLGCWCATRIWHWWFSGRYYLHIYKYIYIHTSWPYKTLSHIYKKVLVDGSLGSWGENE